jgi:hypothetical protein
MNAFIYIVIFIFTWQSASKLISATKLKTRNADYWALILGAILRVGLIGAGAILVS